MIVLFESPKGYSILNHTKDSTALLQSYNFNDQSELIDSYTQIIKGKLPENLTSFLKKCNLSKKESLIVGEKKLAKKLNEELEIKCESNIEVYRNIKKDAKSLYKVLGYESEDDYRTNTLFVAHKMCNEKLALNPEIVDNMAIQAVNMLDDIDNDINMNYMRIKEWYGCHFPELSEILTDNVKYLNVIKFMEKKENLSNEGMKEKLLKECSIDENAFEKMVSMAEMSVGMNLEKIDLDKILGSVNVLLKSFTYREDLHKYLAERMASISPNLTALVGENIGARLMAKLGSLSNLSKAPASTIQILGAEKAYFMAVKGKTNTPKYGILYNSSIVSKASPENKGKVARMLANKIAIAARIDFYRSRNDENIVFDNSYGVNQKEELEKKIEKIENTVKGKKSKVHRNKDKSQFRNTDKYNDNNDGPSNKKRKITN